VVRAEAQALGPATYNSGTDGGVRRPRRTLEVMQEVKRFVTTRILPEVPIMVGIGFPSLRQVRGYGEAPTRIKRVFDPNNILSPNTGLFEDMGK